MVNIDRTGLIQSVLLLTFTFSVAEIRIKYFDSAIIFARILDIQVAYRIKKIFNGGILFYMKALSFTMLLVFSIEFLGLTNMFSG